ncbi:MAG: hypothetical protein Q8Q01_05135 [archaeon]|nr:hypothetical protein [archaeon]
MRFKAKKKYGEYQTRRCPFCERLATHENSQGVGVCHQHSEQKLDEIKCTCGSWLETKSGKFGPYFNCLRCGNISYQKGMEMKSITMKDVPKKVVIEVKKPSLTTRTFTTKSEPKEITISTNDVEYF